MIIAEYMFMMKKQKTQTKMTKKVADAYLFASYKSV